MHRHRLSRSCGLSSAPTKFMEVVSEHRHRRQQRPRARLADPAALLLLLVVPYRAVTRLEPLRQIYLGHLNIHGDTADPPLAFGADEIHFPSNGWFAGASRGETYGSAKILHLFLVRAPNRRCPCFVHATPSTLEEDWKDRGQICGSLPAPSIQIISWEP